MTVGVKDALTGSQFMEVDATWASSSAKNGYSGETVSIAGYNRSFDTYAGPGSFLVATEGNDALLYDTSGSGKRDANDVPVADAHHFAGIGVFVMGLGNDVLDLTAPGGTGSYGTGVGAYGDTSDAQVGGVDGNDVLWGGGRSDKIYGDAATLSVATAGDDRLHGGAGNDFLFGDSDALDGGAAGDDALDGGIGGDQLFGDGEFATGSGVLGADLLDGGIGNDSMYGDAATFSLGGVPFTGTRGADTFRFDGPGSGVDTVGDFEHGRDHLQLKAGYGYTAADALAHTSDVGGRAVVDLGNGDSIALAGVTTGQLAASDFVIA